MTDPLNTVIEAHDGVDRWSQLCSEARGAR
jgi:hypothetical protein